MSLDSRINRVTAPLIYANQRAQQVQTDTMRTSQQTIGTVKALTDATGDTSTDASKEIATVDLGGTSVSAVVGNRTVRINDPVITLGGRIFQ